MCRSWAPTRTNDESLTCDLLWSFREIVHSSGSSSQPGLVQPWSSWSQGRDTIERFSRLCEWVRINRRRIIFLWPNRVIWPRHCHSFIAVGPYLLVSCTPYTISMIAAWFKIRASTDGQSSKKASWMVEILVCQHKLARVRQWKINCSESPRNG